MADFAHHPDEGPAYRRVKDRVLAHIRAGVWAVGERIPSEHDLKAEFGVSRMTVHRAIRELTDEGYVSRTVGAGTYVADHRAMGATLRIREIADEAREAGRRCRARLVTASRGTASRETAPRLGIALGAPTVCVTLVHWLGPTPIELEERWVNAALAPTFVDHDLERESPAAVLARLIPDATLAYEIRATMPKGRARTLLALAPGEPCLMLSSTLSSPDGVVSVADLCRPGGRYVLPGHFL